MSAIAIRAVLRLFGMLPLPVAHAAGSLIGAIVWILPSRVRATTRNNLARCFPGKNAAELGQLARASLQQSGCALADCAQVWTRPASTTLARIRSVHGADLLAAARERGKGVIIAAPHIGAWEMAGVYLAREIPFTAMFRPPRLHAFGPVLRDARLHAGIRSVPIDASGIRELHRALGRGECIGILPDQAPRGGNSVVVPFFGEPAATMTLLPRLARKSGATVLYAAMIRLPRGRGHEFHLFPADPAIQSDNDTEAATAMNRDMEAVIRQFPEQYNWSYRRFRRLSKRHQSERH